MVVFDYKCLNNECETIQERFVKNTEDFQFCHKCGSEMKKMLSAPAMVKGNEYGDKCGNIRPKL